MAKDVKPILDDLTKRLKLIKAKDIMTKDVITTKENIKLADVAEIMINERISGLPVVGRGGKIEGIITETDLFLVMDMIKLGDIVQNGMKKVSNPKVKFAMSTDAVTIEKNTTLEEIFTIMKYRNAHTLPVLDGKKIVGIIGMRDVFKTFYAVLKGLL